MICSSKNSNNTVKTQIPDYGKYLVGYDARDQLFVNGLPNVDVSKDIVYGKKFFEPEIFDKMDRKCVARQLPVGFACAPFKPNNSFKNKELACIRRIGREIPRVCNKTMKAFGSFVAEHVETKLKNKVELVLCPDVDEMNYIDNLSHNEARKTQLRNAVNTPQDYRVEVASHRINSFIKEEFYDEAKNPRLIMPRHDKFKVKFGRFIKELESNIFSKPNFIKKIPSAERPTVLFDKLNPQIYKIIETDYTSWEASMKRQMVTIEHSIYKALMKLVPEFSEFESLLKKVISKNILRLGYQNIRVEGRASGENTTSLGNTLLNYYIWKFVCKKMGIKSKSFFEGDDGIAAVPQHFDVDKAIAIMKRLGMIVKMKLENKIGDVSFCGCRFDDVDMVNTTDPIRYLSRFGWSSRQYCSSGPHVRRELAKLKAMSTLAAYPGCPVIAPFAQWVYKQLSEITDEQISLRIKKNHDSSYTREWLQSNLKQDLIQKGLTQPILMNTRMFVQEKYNITIAEQIELENKFNGDLTIFPSNVLKCPETWIDFYDNYTVDNKDLVNLPW